MGGRPAVGTLPSSLGVYGMYIGYGGHTYIMLKLYMYIHNYNIYIYIYIYIYIAVSKKTYEIVPSSIELNKIHGKEPRANGPRQQGGQSIKAPEGAMTKATRDQGPRHQGTKGS